MRSFFPERKEERPEHLTLILVWRLHDAANRAE